jgi:hypothetical protein
VQYTYLFIFCCCLFVFGLRFLSDRPPSKFERIVAFCWLLFRRLVAFSGALLFLFGGVSLLLKVGPFASVNDGLLGRILLSLPIFLLAAFCVWIGVFGQGTHRYHWKDDVDLHNKNKNAIGGDGSTHKQCLSKLRYCLPLRSITL